MTQRIVFVAGFLCSMSLSGCGDATSPGTARDTTLPKANFAIVFPSDSLFFGRTVRATLDTSSDSAPGTHTPFAWSSADTSIAVIDSIGTMLAVGTGSVAISATRDGRTASRTLRVVVQRADGGVTFGHGSYGFGRGQCAIATSGALYCRQVEAATDSTPLMKPMPGAAGLTFTEVHTAIASQCGLTSDGRIYCWGQPSHYIWGTKVSTPALTAPIAVQHGALRFSTMAHGGHSQMCGVSKADNVLYCWGHNDSNQLGRLPAMSEDSVPAPVAGNLKALAASTSNGATCLLDLTGAMFCSGTWNYIFGVTSATSLVSTPQPTPAGLLYTSLSVGDGMQCAISSTSDAYCWGENDKGQLGNGQMVAPTPMTPQKVLGGYKFASISYSYPDAACGVTTTGALYCWGRFKPFAVSDRLGARAATPYRMLAGITVRETSMHLSDICAVATDGKVFCW